MRNSWIVLSFVGLVSLSIMTVIITYLVRKGLPTVFVLFMVVLIVTVILGALMLSDSGARPSTTLAGGTWALLVVAGILSTIGNLALFKASAGAPNAGLVVGIVGLQGGLVAALAVFFLKDKLNLIQCIGIMIGIVAIIVMGLGSRASKTTARLDDEHVPVIVDKIT